MTSEGMTKPEWLALCEQLYDICHNPQISFSIYRTKDDIVREQQFNPCVEVSVIYH